MFYDVNLNIRTRSQYSNIPTNILKVVQVECETGDQAAALAHATYMVSHPSTKVSVNGIFPSDPQMKVEEKVEAAPAKQDIPVHTGIDQTAANALYMEEGAVHSAPEDHEIETPEEILEESFSEDMIAAIEKTMEEAKAEVHNEANAERLANLISAPSPTTDPIDFDEASGNYIVVETGRIYDSEKGANIGHKAFLRAQAKKSANTDK